MNRSTCLLLATVAFAACAPPAAAPHGAPCSSAVATVGASVAPTVTAAPVATPTANYDLPPANVLDVLRAPSSAVPYVNSTGDTILLVSWAEYPSIARVAEPFLRLAGVRVEPRTRRRHDTPGGYGIPACARDFTLVSVATGAETHVKLPEGGCAEANSWSTDGKRFVFRNTSANAVELWIGDGATGEVHAIPGTRLNPMLGSTVQWMPDQKHVLVKLVPSDLPPPPAAAVAPIAPSIQETHGEKGESSTYETRDTLSSKHDEDLFDYYATSQLAVVDLQTGAIAPLGKPGIYSAVDVAPDGDHVLVTSLKKPYSYLVTYGRFAHDVSVWDHTGAVTHVMASLPTADRVPVHGVPTGPREYEWRSTDPATLIWAEALDGGDWKAKVAARDKVMLQKAPFTAPPIEIARTEQRYEGIAWSEKPSLAFLDESDANRHWRRTFTFDADDPKTKPAVLFDLSEDEHYKDPGGFVYRPLPNGQWVVRLDGDAVFLKGQGSSPDGDRPFLDRLDLKTKATSRLFRSEKTAFETFVTLTDPAGRSFLTWHQSLTDPPNAFVRTLGAAISGPVAGEPGFQSTTRAITHFPDPTPAVRAIKKRLVKYKRKDGTDLSFTLYTPPGYQEGTKLPAVLYAYPLDYADPSKAGQVTGSQQTFTRLRQYKLLLLAGYAIIDDASFPIVGDPKKAYDTYLQQLVDDAKAAVDKAVETGVVDRNRIGVTGHSHGALMTVNLLAHSDLFRAGMATSGSYNKTLTPFGFQNERRSVWEARNVYLEASPFFSADTLKLPILIMHGEDDANPGTTPLQATKLYEAIRGNGGTARLVMLPHEPHWYTALESNEQYVFEMLRWFDTYVKNAPAK